MRQMRNNILASGLLALASRASAQVASVCPTTDVCYQLNIPENTASSGSGDIFFQLSAPSSYEWVALGQGTKMAGSNMFVVYTSADGNNVTVSPRLASGYTMPTFDSAAQITLLEGSGVSNGKMIANVKCSNCNSWSGGTADFTGTTGNWVYAFHTTGGPKNSDSTSASISQHDDQNAFSWSYANAKGGNSVNPLLNSASSGTASGGGSVTSCVPRSSSGASAAATGTATSAGAASQTTVDGSTTQRGRPTAFPTNFGSRFPSSFPTGSAENEKRQGITYCDSPSNTGFTPLEASSSQSSRTKMLIAHGTLAALAFVVFFPAGAIAIRLASFPGVVWFHAAFQSFAYLVYIVAFGLGVYIANELQMLDRYHPIIGMVVFVCLFFQPIFGFLHHALFKKYQGRTFWSYAHLWLGRAVITLGIINGGLGFMLASTMGAGSRSGMIAYAVIAAVVWVAWVAASIIGERRKARAAANRPQKYAGEPPRVETAQRDIPHPDNGHYAPAK